jgi:lipopolysaccharide export system protein LptC
MNAERLQGLDSRQDTQNVVAYSSFIRVLKIFLPLAALGVIGILLVWPQLQKIAESPLGQLDIQALQQAETENRLLQPVFNTQDDKGRPVTITAEEAVQKKSNENLIELNKPSAILKGDDRDTTLNAEQGAFDQKNNVIILNTNVVIQDSQNNVLQTQSLTADITNNNVSSNEPTTLTTPQGKIEGQGIIIENNGTKTIFKGPAKAVIQ